MRRLAVPEFVKMFSDLWTSTAELTLYEAGLIEGNFEMVWLGHYQSDQIKSIENTARVAHNVMQQGAARHFDPVIKQYLFNIERLHRILNRTWKERAEALDERVVEKRIMSLLAFYKALYEGLMPVLFAPIIQSMALLSNKKERKKYLIDRDGKASLAQLESIQYEWSSQKKQLGLGLNNHLRNAFAHERFRLIDSGLIDLWDIMPTTGDYSWGPITYSEPMLKEECEALWRNALGIVYGWVIFSVNNRKIIDQGGYFTHMPIARDPLLADEIKGLAETIFSGRGFKIVSYKFADNQLILGLECHLKGIDQDSEIFVGPGRSARKFIVKMSHSALPIVEQFLGGIQELRHQMNREIEFAAAFVEWPDTKIGEIRGNTDLLKQFDGKKLPPIAEFRKLLAVDTVGDAITWRLDESLPREV
jgi:hypothetical protein